MSTNKYRDKVITRKRMVIIFCFLFITFFLLVGRMFYIMIYKSPQYKATAVEQWTSDVKIDAKRGRILDRNGNELAVSANVYRVDLDMNALRDTMKDKKLSKDKVASMLSSALSMEKGDILKVLDKKLPGGLPLAAATLKRRIEKEEADKIRSLNLNGVLVSADTKRYYPNDNFLAHVLGHTNSDGVGLTGIELYYNKELSGTPGRRIAETDSKSKDLPYTISEFTKPVDGKDVELTIDSMIQHFAEKTAEQALKDNKAKAVSIVVMNPNNGEVLAMVNKPDYNPNDPWIEGKTYDELQKSWRNRAVSDTFEPGSIFKVVTADTALETNSVDVDKDTFVCDGSITIGNRTIHCWKSTGHGTQKFPDILKNSCNVGFAQLGKMIGKDKLNAYIQKFGFGQKTGIDLPGEAKGIIKSTKDISDIDLATISFGQANTVTMVQYLRAFNTVANGGYLITPHLMKEIGHYDENKNQEVVDSKYDLSGKNKQKIIDSSKAAQLRGYLERVVSDGGGKNAFIDGYHIAGKTGTAQKAGVGGYQSGKYIASFAGMAPSSNPKITLLVSIDEPDPSNYYAAQTAAPAAKQLFLDIFNYLAMKSDASSEEIARSMLKNVVVPDVRGMKVSDAESTLKKMNLVPESDDKGEYVVDMNPKPGYTIKEGSKVLLYTSQSQDYNRVVTVPDVQGMSPDNVVSVFNTLGLKAQFDGNGMADEQSIEPGKEVQKGTVINIHTEILGD
ncbi:MAG: stage V sporulation protein D [Clostridium sp.]|uniref:stage V sporulation protein D n=1 Tax=Clostridium sp. TaxID=1506 RepID=UPI0025C70EF0|nr:stage V sporulation protein D [Clostridium sp.]MCH3964193.1 stage V sporulation protein D [Clostridium sp.]MCI1715374.1 stage V sporulation protein D [Clostridium sp.]MCI1799835.1 stage V sporulation protein D [Clostridium sp.]MCI1813557.1 stage V sporulation protein D [Clostridium sp.]MCI1870653.1 stage V sporulation protein D [Clostridium sp.]